MPRLSFTNICHLLINGTIKKNKPKLSNLLPNMILKYSVFLDAVLYVKHTIMHSYTFKAFFLVLAHGWVLQIWSVFPL